MVSAVVLTHNDEKIILRSLASLTWCDELIIIDDNSTDKTVALAQKADAKVFVHSLSDDFAGQRNFGLEKAKGEWVFFVDSDEVVPQALAREIKAAVKTVGNPYNGYFLKRKDYWGGRWLSRGEVGNVRLLRLAQKNRGKWRRPVHEEWQVNGPIGKLSAPLLHYPHPNVAQFLEEINQYSTINARFLRSQGISEPAWQIVVKPALKFLVNYFWRLGFLDGTAGAIYAIMMSFHSFLTRSKLYVLNHQRE